jgi:ribosomal protein S4E
MKEVETIMKQRLIKIDGKTRTDPKFPTGFMDVVQIEKTGENFRIIYDVKGRFTVHRFVLKQASCVKHRMMTLLSICYLNSMKPTSPKLTLHFKVQIPDETT